MCFIFSYTCHNFFAPYIFHEICMGYTQNGYRNAYMSSYRVHTIFVFIFSKNQNTLTSVNKIPNIKFYDDLFSSSSVVT